MIFPSVFNPRRWILSWVVGLLRREMEQIGGGRRRARPRLSDIGGCAPAALEQRDDEPQNAADVVRPPIFGRASRKPFRTRAGAVLSRRWFSIFGRRRRRPRRRRAPRGASRAGGDAAATPRRDGFTLNFENTPVANVAKVVLGDILGVGYVIDPRAAGRSACRPGRPVAKKDMLFVLESALRANNLAWCATAAATASRPRRGGPSGVDRE